MTRHGPYSIFPPNGKREKLLRQKFSTPITRKQLCADLTAIKEGMAPVTLRAMWLAARRFGLQGRLEARMPSGGAREALLRERWPGWEHATDILDAINEIPGSGPVTHCNMRRVANALGLRRPFKGRGRETHSSNQRRDKVK